VQWIDLWWPVTDPIHFSCILKLRTDPLNLGTDPKRPDPIPQALERISSLLDFTAFSSNWESGIDPFFVDLIHTPASMLGKIYFNENN